MPSDLPMADGYVFAIMETGKMRSRLYEAIAAVEQRKLIAVNSDEEIALADAEAGLQSLISETIAKFV